MKNATRRLPRVLAAGVALAAGLLLNAPARAQDQGGPQGGRRWEQGQRSDPARRLDRQVAMLTRRLQLGSDQAARVRGILQRQDEQLRAWRQSPRPRASARGQAVPELTGPGAGG